MLNFKDFLDRYEDFLRLLPTSTTSGDGTAMLDEAESTLLGMIDDYIAASDHIRNDPGTESGAEELFEISECDLLGEEFFRNNMEALKESLTSGTVFEYVNKEDTWVFTNSSTGGQLIVYLKDNNRGQYLQNIGTVPFSDPYYFYGNLGCVTFTGTLSSNGTEIADGSFYGWVYDWDLEALEEISGNFSGIRTSSVDYQRYRIDANLIFGNGSGP